MTVEWTVAMDAGLGLSIGCQLATLLTAFLPLFGKTSNERGTLNVRGLVCAVGLVVFVSLSVWQTIAGEFARKQLSIEREQLQRDIAEVKGSVAPLNQKLDEREQEIRELKAALDHASAVAKQDASKATAERAEHAKQLSGSEEKIASLESLLEEKNERIVTLLEEIGREYPSEVAKLDFPAGVMMRSYPRWGEVPDTPYARYMWVQFADGTLIRFTAHLDCYFALDGSGRSFSLTRLKTVPGKELEGPVQIGFEKMIPNTATKSYAEQATTLSIDGDRLGFLQFEYPGDPVPRVTIEP